MTPPSERWRLARQVQPRLLIWLGDDISHIRALDDFAQTIVVVSVDKTVR